MSQLDPGPGRLESSSTWSSSKIIALTWVRAGVESSYMMRRRAFLLSGTAAAAAQSVSFSGKLSLSDLLVRRPFRWRDAENRTSLEYVAISRAGDAIALQVTRPLSAGGRFGGESWGELFDVRGDIWLTNCKLENAKWLSRLAGGAWAPCFSPGGQRLSALTLVGPGRVGLVVWELPRGTCRIFSDPNVEIFLSKFRSHGSAYAAPSALSQLSRQYLWLDDNSILYVDHGPAPQQFLLSSTSLSPTLQAFRDLTERGRSSVRVWNDRSPTCGARSRLAGICLDTGEIGTHYEGDVRGVSLCPNQRSAAVLVATGSYRPTPGKAIDQPLRSTGMDQPMVELKLTLIDLSEPTSARDIEGVTDVGNVAPSRLPRWSDDGSRIAVPVRTSYSDIASTGNDIVWEISAKTGDARKRSASSALDAELLAALIVSDSLNAELLIDKRPQQVRVDDYTSVGEIRGGAWRCAPRQVLFWNAPALTLITPARKIRLPGDYVTVYSPVSGKLRVQGDRG